MSVGLFSILLCIHTVDIETVGLHGLILCVSEGMFSMMFYMYSVGNEAFGPHELI